MKITPSEVLTDISKGMGDGSLSVYYASSDQDLFYAIGHGEGEWTAKPISDERHEILLTLKQTGQLLEDATITVTYRDGFKLQVRALKPADYTSA